MVHCAHPSPTCCIHSRRTCCSLAMRCGMPDQITTQVLKDNWKAGFRFEIQKCIQVDWTRRWVLSLNTSITVFGGSVLSPPGKMASVSSTSPLDLLLLLLLLLLVLPLSPFSLSLPLSGSPHIVLHTENLHCGNWKPCGKTV